MNYASAVAEEPQGQSWDNLPPRLKAVKQWVCFRLVQNDPKKKCDKVPYHPKTGRKINPTDPANWSDFETATSACHGSDFDGIGFVFSETDPYTGVDLDGVIDPDSGEIAPNARSIIDELDSYTEVSPSGTGTHTIVLGKKPNRKCRKGNVEMYDSGRYFTMTGNHLSGTPRTIEPRQPALDSVHAQHIGGREKAKASHLGEGPVKLTDKEIIEKASNSQNGKKFDKLFSGEWRDDYQSQSEADFALCGMLAYHTGRDPERMDVLFRQSRLMRPKWDEQRGAQTYGERTIEAARSKATTVYQNHENDKLLRELNDKHIVVREGGKTCVVNLEMDHTLGRRIITRSNFTDFRQFYQNRKIQVGIKNDTPVFVDVGKWWLDHAERRQYETVVFAPGREIPGAFNLWNGFAVEARSGDWRLLEWHLLHVVCGGNKEHFQYLLTSLARVVQQPDRQGEVCIVFRGGQGVGKGVVMTYFGGLFGQHFLQISNVRHLTGNFNAHLRDCVVLFADEAFWAGDKTGKAVLKMLITERMLPYEAKGKDAVLGPNFVHLFMASNETWVVPAEEDDRRFFILDVSGEKKGDRAYFLALWKEMENGGREALLYDLLEMDLADFEVRDIPQTAALVEQKHLTLCPEDKWLFEKLQEGRWFKWHSDWHEHDVPANLLWEDYTRHTGITGDRHKAVATSLGTRMKRIFGKGLKKVRNQTIRVPSGEVYTTEVDGHRVGDPIFRKEYGSVYHFPPLLDARRAFEEHIGSVGQVEWEDENENGEPF